MPIPCFCMLLNSWLIMNMLMNQMLFAVCQNPKMHVSLESWSTIGCCCLSSLHATVGLELTNHNIPCICLKLHRFDKWFHYLHICHPLTPILTLCHAFCSYVLQISSNFTQLFLIQFLSKNLEIFSSYSWMCPSFYGEF
jgi:hypothetical protein